MVLWRREEATFAEESAWDRLYGCDRDEPDRFQTKRAKLLTVARRRAGESWQMEVVPEDPRINSRPPSYGR